MVRARPLAVAAAAVLAGCTTGGFSGDPYPVHVDLTQGPILVQLAIGDGAPVDATLDVMAPFTLVDPGAGASATREKTTVELLGEITPGSVDHVPRARFAVDVVSYHPCDTPDCTVGDPAAPTPIGAVLGADALASDALRLDFPASDVYVLPNIGGDDEARSRQCDAVFSAPFRGGGTLVLGGAEVGFDGLRVAIGGCLSPDPANGDPLGRGTDALFVLSTAIGPSLIGTTAYQRYCQPPHACATTNPALLPQETVLLPSGPITGGVAQIPSLALVGLPTNNARGPCEDLYASHFLVENDCSQVSCPCTSGQVCGAPAAVELAPATPIDMIVVDDADPTLQALRTELRPDQAEVDGILGTTALAALQLDLDYPDGRVLARCGAGVDPATCKVRPALFSGSYKARVLACVGP